MRSAATFDAILEGAARILEVGGLAAFNTNAVAERSGVGVGTLYQYFPSKEALLAELIRRKRADLLARLDGAAMEKRPASLPEAVDTLIRAALADSLRRPGLARVLEYAEAMLPIDGETAALKREITDRIAAVLAAHDVTDPRACARDIAALSRGLIDTAGRFGENDLPTLDARLRRAILGYLAYRPEPGG